MSRFETRGGYSSGGIPLLCIKNRPSKYVNFILNRLLVFNITVAFAALHNSPRDAEEAGRAAQSQDLGAFGFRDFCLDVCPEATKVLTPLPIYPFQFIPKFKNRLSLEDQKSEG
jgi:hypothetical protein